MTNKPKTRAEEIAYDVGVKNGREGNDNCPYMTAQYAQCWRDGHARGKAANALEQSEIPLIAGV